MKTKWTQEQTEYLKNNYEYTKTPELLKVLADKTNDQLRWKAKDLGITKKVSRTKTDISFLENFDDPESLYWWGFLTADGCFTKRQLIFSLHERDKESVILFANKCNSNVKYVTRQNSWNPKPYTMARTVVNDKFIIGRIMGKLNIVPQKTYNPFDINIFLEKDRILYYLIGLIDGDGYICSNGSVRIKIHPSWENNLKLIADRLKVYFGIKSSVLISREGWVTLTLC